MENDFLADLQRQGRVDLPEPKTEKEPDEKPTPSSPEEKESEQEQSPSSQGEQEKGDAKPDNTENDNNLPFHKHPRWKAQQQELKEAREFREYALPLLKRLGEKPDRDEETVEIPDWFAELYGDNAEAWKKYRAYDTQQRKQLRAEILEDMQKEQQKATEAQSKQEKWVEDELSKLTEDGLKFDRNELLKIAVDYKPTDDEGNISLRKAYDILVMQGAGKEDKPKSEEKKKVADKTMGKGKPSGEKKDYMTSADLRGKSMLDLIPRD